MSGWRQTRTAQQKFPRHAARVAVRISTVDPEVDPDSGEAFFRSTEATTANLSRGGAFVDSWEPLAPGRRVIVALDLPSGGELALVGQVVWTKRRLASRQEGILEAPGYGIQFVGSRAEQAAIQQILDAAGSSAQSDTDAPTIGAVPSAPVNTTPPAQSPSANASSPASVPAAQPTPSPSRVAFFPAR
ncbi:PilZ domain-containing protein [Myxococcota bacterium]|nr:PilZ domain-containing protein [Myxococcota bacterium]